MRLKNTDKAAALTFYLLIALAYCIAYAGSPDLSALIHAGDRYPYIGEDGAYVYPSSDGYDGQWYYHIAKDPLNVAHAKLIKEAPGYRYQRILYPLLSYLVALGDVSLLPYSMFAVNLASVLLSAHIFSKMVKGYALYPTFLAGVFTSTLLELAEPLWVMLCLAALYYLRQDRIWHSALAFTFAFLTKETTLYLLAPAVLYLSLRQRSRSLPLTLPFAVFGLWQLLLSTHFGKPPFLTSQRFGYTFLGLVDAFAQTDPLTKAFIVSCAVPLTVSVDIVRCKRFNLSSTILVFNTLAVASFHRGLFVDVFASSRILLPLAVASLYYLAETQDHRIHFFLFPQALASLALASYYVFKLVSLFIH